MNFHPLILLAAVLACQGPAAAQNAEERARHRQPSLQAPGVLHDGIVFDRGSTFLVRHGRAALVNEALVPEGQVLTAGGRLLPLRMDPEKDVWPVMALREGLFALDEQAYLVRDGRVMLVDALLVPKGRGLTVDGRFLLLPADFSGFVRDRGPDGAVLPRPTAQVSEQSFLRRPVAARAASVVSVARSSRLTPSNDFQRAMAARLEQELHMTTSRPTANVRAPFKPEN